MKDITHVSSSRSLAYLLHPLHIEHMIYLIRLALATPTFFWWGWVFPFVVEDVIYVCYALGNIARGEVKGSRVFTHPLLFMVDWSMGHRGRLINGAQGSIHLPLVASHPPKLFRKNVQLMKSMLLSYVLISSPPPPRSIFTLIKFLPPYSTNAALVAITLLPIIIILSHTPSLAIHMSPTLL